MTELTEFIETLNNFSESEFIDNFEELILSLNKLNSMIGMQRIKKDIITQIQFYLVNCNRNKFVYNASKLDSHMFHTVLTGPPGCGKTTVAEIMAEIYLSLGLITAVEPETSKPKIIIDSLIDFIDNQKEIDDLKEKNQNLQCTIQNKNDTLIKVQNLMKNVRFLFREYKRSPDKKIFRNCMNKIATINENLNQGIDIHTKEIKPKVTAKNLIVKLRRDDLIGKYVGHTAVKTREALTKGLGKVIFIDEAYELYNTTGENNDSFGMECLNTILSFMNEYPDKCIIIFAGYEDLLNKTIFRVQPGLQRRIAWNFSIDKYTNEELVNIFEKQLMESNWFLDDKNGLISLFKSNEKLFKFAGGDTLRLTMYVKNIYAKVSFEKLIKNEYIDSIITHSMIKDAMKILEQNQEVLADKISEPPPGMYI